MKIELPVALKACDGDEITTRLEKFEGYLGLKTLAGKEFLRIALENTILMDKKQQDYGSKNISGFGTFGVIVRANDKFERIKHMFANKRKRAVNESMIDSFRDVSNYAIIALMLEQKVWPNE